MSQRTRVTLADGPASTARAAHSGARQLHHAKAANAGAQPRRERGSRLGRSAAVGAMLAAEHRVAPEWNG